MEITVAPDRIKATIKCSPEQMIEVKKLLSYKEKVFEGRKRVSTLDGSRMVQKFKTVTKVAMKGNTILAGLVPRVVEGFREGVCKVSLTNPLTDDQLGLHHPIQHLGDIHLRDYQKEAVQRVVEKRRGLIVFPTGSGKTVMMAAVIASYIDCTFVVFVQKVDLLNQTVKNLEKMLGEKVGCVGAGKSDWQPVTVCTIQSFLSGGYALPWVDGIIVDEVHHAGSPSYRKALTRIGSEIRVGFTATEAYIPKKQFQIEGLFGQTIHTMPYEELEAEGKLAKGEVHMYEIPINPDVFTMSGSNWHAVYNHGIVHNPDRNSKITILARDYRDEGKKVLIIVNKLDHGYLLHGMCGSESDFVHGSTDVEERGKVGEALRGEGGKIVIATNIFDEGMDFPDLDVVLLARGWESPIATVQSAGRATRVTDSKKNFLVIDFYDRTHKILKKHSNTRIRTYKQKGWDVIIKAQLDKKPLLLLRSAV